MFRYIYLKIVMYLIFIFYYSTSQQLQKLIQYSMVATLCNTYIATQLLTTEGL